MSYADQHNRKYENANAEISYQNPLGLRDKRTIFKGVLKGQKQTSPHFVRVHRIIVGRFAKQMTHEG